MKRLLPADCLPCGCINEEMLSSFISSCFRDWGKYGDAEEIGLSECRMEVRWSSETQMFMGICGKACFVVFRGYDRFHSVINDIDTMAVPFDMVNSGARVNAVFLNAYKDLRDDLFSYIGDHDLRIVHFIGHSMGGAMATLAAADVSKNLKIHTHCCTFGSPKVGDAWFKKIYVDIVESTERYVLSSDPIPLYPWEKEYVHICDPQYVGPLIGRIRMFIASLRHFFMMILGMSTRMDKGKMIASLMGTDGHELYNYSSEVRKSGKDLI